MKKIRKILCLIMVLALSIPSVVYAAIGNSDTGMDDLMLKAAMEVHDMQNKTQPYSGDDAYIEYYNVYNSANQDITENFLNDTYSMYISKDIERLQKYCDDNIKKIVKTSEQKYLTERMDIGKTVDRKMVEILQYRDVPCTVDYTVRGSITYNPNTYQITYASTPIVLNKVITAPSHYVIVTQNEYGSSKIASNKLSASFSYGFDVQGRSDYDNPNFGRTTCSFVITPN